MDQEIEQEIREINDKLDRLERLSDENHEMLKSINNRARINTAMSVVKWVIVIGLWGGVLFYLQPYLEKIIEMYSGLYSVTGGLENNGGTGILDMLKTLK